METEKNSKHARDAAQRSAGHAAADSREHNVEPANAMQNDTEELSEVLGDVTEKAATESTKESARAAEELAVAYKRLTAERQELYDRLLRKQAELENFRKRAQKEKEEFLQHANADLIRLLLPALDGFDRALKQRDEKVPAHFYQGLELIYRQLTEALARAGLKAVETKGKLFDPQEHEAAEKVETARHRDQEIVEELQRGYKLRHRLLRAAVVKVAVHPPNGGSESPPDNAADSNKSSSADRELSQ